MNSSVIMPTIEDVRKQIEEEERQQRIFSAFKEIGYEAATRLTEYAAAFMQRTNLKPEEIELVVWRDNYNLDPEIHFLYRRRSDAGNIEANNG